MEGGMNLLVKLCWQVTSGATITVFYGGQTVAEERASDAPVCTSLRLLRGEEFVYARIELPASKSGQHGLSRYRKMSIFDRKELEITEGEFSAAVRQPSG
jgi:hypothetical protein